MKNKAELLNHLENFLKEVKKGDHRHPANFFFDELDTEDRIRLSEWYGGDMTRVNDESHFVWSMTPWTFYKETKRVLVEELNRMEEMF